MAIVELILILVVVLALGAAIQIARERSVARAAGMSEATPVCAGCHYPLRGWTSPHCPECGGDIRSSGVRTGPRANQALLGTVAVLLCLVVVAPVMMQATGWIFAEQTRRADGRFTSSELPWFHVSLAIDGSWRRFPPRHDHETTVRLLAFTESGHAGAWVNGRFVGSRARREQVLGFTDQDDARSGLGTGVVDVAVQEVLGADVDAATRNAHARAIESLVRTMVEASSRSELESGLLLSWSDGPLRSAGSGGHRGGRGAALAAPVLTLLAVLISVWLALRLVGRWCRSGWRLPAAREWEHASRARNRTDAS